MTKVSRSDQPPDNGNPLGPAGRVLSSSTWPEIAGGSLLVVPVGATEQHGPHLPLDTDTAVATELASRLVSARVDTVLAPALAYGASGEHQGFAGTLSIGAEVLQSVLVELVRSADHLAGTVLVSGHGGNAVPLRHAVVRLEAEGRRVMSWSPTAAVLAGAAPDMTARLAGDHHAGLVETSIMLALRPESVRPWSAAAAPVVALLAELMPGLVRDGVIGVAPDGVLGDPSGASAEMGRRWLSALAADLVQQVADWEAATRSSAGPDNRSTAGARPDAYAEGRPR